LEYERLANESKHVLIVLLPFQFTTIMETRGKII
jgi:hypothetical protein